MVAVVLAGYSGGSGVGGGADSYGYLSQADLWLKGDLITEQPGAARAPWPDAQSTLAPLGYRASPSRDAIVPIYYDPLQASKLSRQPMIVAAPRSESVTVCIPPAAPPSQFPFR